MVTALAPIAIFVGVSATVLFAFFSFWGTVNERATARVRGLGDQLDRAGIRMSRRRSCSRSPAVSRWCGYGSSLRLQPALLVALLACCRSSSVRGAIGFYAFVQFRVRTAA